jgi:hypothetical protein
MSKNKIKISLDCPFKFGFIVAGKEANPLGAGNLKKNSPETISTGAKMRAKARGTTRRASRLAGRRRGWRSTRSRSRRGTRPACGRRGRRTRRRLPSERRRRESDPRYAEYCHPQRPDRNSMQIDAEDIPSNISTCKKCKNVH